MLEAQLRVVKEQILENDRRVRASARETELGRRLMEIPGVGPLLASAFVATVADPHAFKSGRCLSAWIGLVPKQNSSGGKERLGSISKAGNRYLRQLLVVGAMAVIRYAERNGTRRPWLVQLMARRTHQGRSGCARQQDRPDGLGTDDQRRTLQGADHRIERDKARGRRRGWKGRTGANAQSRLIPPDQENPLGPCTSSASFRSGPEPREWHYGQRQMKSRTYRSDTWPHQPATAKSSKNPLPTESRPYTAPFRTHVVSGCWRLSALPAPMPLSLPLQNAPSGLRMPSRRQVGPWRGRRSRDKRDSSLARRTDRRGAARPP